MDILDRDTAEVVARLRESIAGSGLSQAAFARAVGTSAPRLSTYLSGATSPSARFLVRAGRLGRAVEAAAARGLMSAPATAAAMRRYVVAGEVEWTWRMLLQGRDHLALMVGLGEQTLLDSWEAAPGSAGSAQWSALLGALAAHEFESADVAPPRWTAVEQLTEPWQPKHPFLSADRVRAMTPPWLSRRDIYVPARDLITA